MPPIKEESRNFYTSPPKKGGYGYIDGTIGKPYPYIPTPYERERQLLREDKEESKLKRINSKPFVGANVGQEYFDENPYEGTGTVSLSLFYLTH
jgi:hypothetical protein